MCCLINNFKYVKMIVFYFIYYFEFVWGQMFKIISTFEHLYTCHSYCQIFLQITFWNEMSLISLISCKWLFMWKIFFLRYCCFHSKLSLIYARQIFDRPSSLEGQAKHYQLPSECSKVHLQVENSFKSRQEENRLFFLFFFWCTNLYWQEE